MADPTPSKTAAASSAAATKMLQITLIKSTIGYSERHKATVKALGLRKLHQSVTLPDSPSLRGMLLKVNHLVKIEEVK